MSTLKEQEATDELDDLLSESLAKPKTKAKAGDLTDLDDLLRESLAIRDEQVAVKTNREKLKRGNLSRDERDEIVASIRKWEAVNVWTTVANVAVFEKISCSCGFYTESFSHMMHKQQHRADPKLIRLVQTDDLILALPRIVARQVSDVDLCSECAAGKGWNLDEAEEGIEWQANVIKA